MSLALYNKKRHFDETPEPKGAEKSSKGSLRFVIQKHDASSLHYDFRLEMKGVLKSWAVPKGPSLNPADKRLAMMVEDHPYDYRNFEGIIPAGNYGGGTVIIWDEGTYELADAAGMKKEEQEKALLKGIYSGSLRIELNGKKIKGSYSLRRLNKEDNQKAWLLIKSKDQWATTEDITFENKSVRTGKTIAQVAAENGTEPNHPEAEKGKQKKAARIEPVVIPQKKKAPAKAANPKKKIFDVAKAAGPFSSALRKSTFPKEVQPMLATLVDAPFDDKEWLFEIKWDGYRAVAYVNEGKADIISRNKKSFSEKYFPVVQALQQLPVDAVFDGEIVAIDEKGLANFQALQNWQNTPVRLQFFIFDIVWLNGYDLTALPLVQRKEMLEQVIPEDDTVLRCSDHIIEKGKDFFKVALGKGLEGIMAKKADSLYLLGSRAETWLKIKVNLRQEVVIAGYTAPRNTRKYFGALLLGVYDANQLVYIGHSGSGFNKKSLEEIYTRLQPLIIEDCPFEKCPRGNMPATWVKPLLVCEIKFTEWTKERIARHPIFMGLRTDKDAKQVKFEKSKTIKTMAKSASIPAAASKKAAVVKKGTPRKSAAKKSSTKKGAAKTSGKKLDAENGADQVIQLEGGEVSVSSLNKLYWKKEGLTKLDSINYYLEAAPFILPYLLLRPMSLNRHPNGIDAPNFFQKDMKGSAPGFAQTHIDFSESTNVNVEYLVCNSEATLIYMANLGCIEMNPWHSRSQTWQQPDWCLIDLDPDKPNTFNQVIDVAHLVKKVLDSIGADSYVKTSGSSGIHIYIPLGGKYSFEQSKQLAELVVTLVNAELPDLTSVERNPAKRKGRIYLDFLQNRETQTAAAPYSLRPKRGAPVSTPLDWTEVKHGLTPTTYHMRNIFDRLKIEGDLFSPVLGKGINLQKVLRTLESIAK